MWALNRRRIMNAAIGAIGGLLTGLGLAVTVSQGGRINPAESETIAGIACAILIGAALGAADLGKWGKRALVVVTLSLPLLSPAATAQQAPRCTDVASVAVTAFIGEEPVVVDVAGATESEPLELDLTRLDGLGFAVELTDPTLQGSFTLEVAEVRPFGFLGGTGLVYHGPVDQGLAKGNIEIRGTWPLQVTPVRARPPSAKCRLADSGSMPPSVTPPQVPTAQATSTPARFASSRCGSGSAHRRSGTRSGWWRWRCRRSVRWRSAPPAGEAPRPTPRPTTSQPTFRRRATGRYRSRRAKGPPSIYVERLNPAPATC